MSRIRITPLAEQDLVEIWYFIAQDDPLAADRLLDLLEEKYKLLADNPHMGPTKSPRMANRLEPEKPERSSGTRGP
jgi:toxin ParE1/3/4